MSAFLLYSAEQEEERKEEESMCVSVYVFAHFLHTYVDMDGGDVMSGIDPLNMAPSHHNDDIIHSKKKRRKTAAV